ncbi:MAG: glycosidase [Deltaproteobacteria bacterium]|nr:glycosidase [Deltaproteobacteria bacterium]
MNPKLVDTSEKRLRGVMFNAYPDSIGSRLSDSVNLLARDELKGAFSLFYILPTFFNSDLDRGFSIIDYNLNRDLVSPDDLAKLEKLQILLKFDLVLNHLSVGSPQFRDMLKHGDASEFKDFFINWNEFWQAEGELGADGVVTPKAEHLQKLFMRKPGLPILKVRFPDGTERPYWNTFYQQVDYHPIASADLAGLQLSTEQVERIAVQINAAIAAKEKVSSLTLDVPPATRDKIIDIVEKKRTYLGQMDLNARSEKVWKFYEETFRKLKSYGATLIRLDAFAYLHKQPGMVNFFNKPETWNYLGRLKEMATNAGLILLPEIHSEYGIGLHEEVANAGYSIYDFFFPGLILDAIDRANCGPLLAWIHEIRAKKLFTINMLGCHDGIPVLDLKGRPGRALLGDQEIDEVVTRVIDRGGRVKNLYGPDGKKISYYQVNATFFSALGEDERKFLLARAVQMFMPGIPQVWYLDLFAGKNNYQAADCGGAAGHKEINRTTLSLSDIETGLKRPIVQRQLELIKLRNSSVAFDGDLVATTEGEHLLQLVWTNEGAQASLSVDFRTHSFEIQVRGRDGVSKQISSS